MGTVEIGILIWVVMLVAAYRIADSKGRNPQGAVLWTLLMGPIGLLGVIFWKREDELAEDEDEGEGEPSRRPAYSQRLRQRRADSRRWRP